MAELYKRMKALNKYLLIIFLIAMVLLVLILYVANFYAESEQLNKKCDNSTYILSNYSADLSKNITNSDYPLIWNHKS